MPETMISLSDMIKTFPSFHPSRTTLKHRLPLFTGPTARLSDALARVENQECKMRNVKDREGRAKVMVHGLLEK